MFTRQEKFEHRRRTWIAIWIIGMMMLGMVPFLPGGSADTSSNINCAIGVNWYNNYGTWTHDQGYLLPGGAIDRSYFAFNLNSIGAGKTIQSVTLGTYVSNGPSFNGYMSVLEIDPFTNATFATTSTSTEISQVAANTLNNGWSTISTTAITNYVAAEYAAHSGWVYIAFRGNGLTGAAAWGMGGDTNAYPNYIVVTYTASAVVWGPTITSDHVGNDTGAVGYPYSYHLTANESVTWDVYSMFKNDTAVMLLPDTTIGTPTDMLRSSGTDDWYTYLRGLGDKWIVWNGYGGGLYCSFDDMPAMPSGYTGIANVTAFSYDGSDVPSFGTNHTHLYTTNPQVGGAWTFAQVNATYFDLFSGATTVGEQLWVNGVQQAAWFSGSNSNWGAWDRVGLVVWVDYPTATFSIDAQGYLNGTISQAGSYEVHIKATSVAGTGSSWQNFTINSTAAFAPAFTSSPITSVMTLDAYSYTVTTNVSSTIELVNTTAYEWLTYSSGNSTLWGRAPYGQYSYTVSFRAIANVIWGYQNYTLNVQKWGPSWASNTVIMGQAYNLVYLQDPYDIVIYFNETCSASMTTNASFLTAWPNANYIYVYDNWYATTGDDVTPVGSYWVSIEANSTIGKGLSWYNYTLSVTLGPAPVFTSSPVITCSLNTAYSYHVATDVASTITLYASNASWLTYSSGNSTLWGLAPGTIHSYTISFKAILDTGHYTGWQNFTISLSDVTNPTANAGPDQVGIVITYTTVHFNGAGSTDNVGIVNYSWAIMDGVMHSAYGIAPTYIFTTIGVHVIWLSVYDAAGNAGTDSMTVTTIAVPILQFTNTWIIGHDASSFNNALTTNIAGSTYTLVIAPTCMAIVGSSIHVTNPAEGQYTVTVKAHNTLYGSQNRSVSYMLTITPASYGGPIVQPLWELVMPFIILLVITMLSAISRDGISGTSFLGSLTIGIFLLSWSGAMGMATFAGLAIGAILMMIMVVRAYREVT
jgi:hypothetical protein